jgi:hypothetical protein
VLGRLLAAIQAVGNLAASVIAGILWTAISPTAAFIYVATWMLLALAGLLLTVADPRTDKRVIRSTATT